MIAIFPRSRLFKHLPRAKAVLAIGSESEAADLSSEISITLRSALACLYLFGLVVVRFLTALLNNLLLLP